MTTPEVDPAAPETIRAWVQADRHGDLMAMAEQLAEGVVLVSPLTDAFRFVGRQDVMAVFASAFEHLTDVEILRVTGSGTDWALHGRQRLRGRNLEEIQWLRLDGDGRIDQVTLFIRPLPAVAAMLTAIGPSLARRGVLPRAAGTASRAALPLGLVTGLVERFVMPRLRPFRR